MTGETPTLRQIHERCKARHYRVSTMFGGTACIHCGKPWGHDGCPDYSDAVAAVDILGRADSVFDEDGTCHMPRIREIPDPDPQPSSRPAEATPLPDAEGKP